MSSNLRIQRVCKYCQKEFEARKTTSQTCSDHCAKMYYKVKKRAAKVEASNIETQAIKEQPLNEIKTKEFLTVRDVAKLIGCSRQTVYNLITTGSIKAVNIKIKKTLIKRSEIDKLFA